MAVVVAVDIRIEVMITDEEVMEAATITEYLYIYIVYHMRDFSTQLRLIVCDAIIHTKLFQRNLYWLHVKLE